MNERENPALSEAEIIGRGLGLTGSVLECFVEGFTTPHNETLILEMEGVDSETPNIPYEPIVQNFVTDFGSSQEHSGNIFSFKSPVVEDSNTVEGPDKRKPKQSKKQENPWSKTTPSGNPRGPDSYAKKKSRKRDYRQESIRKRHGW